MTYKNSPQNVDAFNPGTEETYSLTAEHITSALPELFESTEIHRAINPNAFRAKYTALNSNGN